jgi:hypothetical protein
MNLKFLLQTYERPCVRASAATPGPRWFQGPGGGRKPRAPSQRRRAGPERRLHGATGGRSAVGAGDLRPQLPPRHATGTII